MASADLQSNIHGWTQTTTIEPTISHTKAQFLHNIVCVCLVVFVHTIPYAIQTKYEETEVASSTVVVCYISTFVYEPRVQKWPRVTACEMVMLVLKAVNFILGTRRKNSSALSHSSAAVLRSSPLCS